METPKIYLSPSNQSDNLYATGGTNEKHQCDKIAAAAGKALTRCGIAVMVGKSDTPIETRCKESDAFKADVHMPIHTNAFDKKTTGGTLIMVAKLDTTRVKAGSALLRTVGKISPGKDYTLRVRTDLYEINTPKAMTLYLEVEFHDTKTGSDWIRNNINEIGEAIAEGMCDYFGVKYVAPGSETSTKKDTTQKKMYRVFRVSKNKEEQQGAFSAIDNAMNLAKKELGKGNDVKLTVRNK